MRSNPERKWLKGCHLLGFLLFEVASLAISTLHIFVPDCVSVAPVVEIDPGTLVKIKVLIKQQTERNQE